MGKGPDQGDFGSPTPDTTSSPSVWPTEPDQAPSSALATATISAPGSDVSTAVVEQPSDVDQLPTTSGTDAVAVAIGAACALALVGTGLVLAWKRRSRPHW